MTKNPSACKNSHLFGDVYICKLECVPCSALKKCALESIDDMVKATQEFIDSMPDFPKKEDPHDR